VDRTKRRIIKAAILEYLENGIPDTSMQAVARRADVAPGTVLYHYPNADELAEAVIQSWMAGFEAPSVESIPAEDPLDLRIAKLIREVFSLYERSDVAYRVYAKSPDHPVLKRYEGWWNENVGKMLLRALGERAREAEALQVLSVLVDPGFRGTLIGRGLSAERAVGVATELAACWLDRQRQSGD